MALRRRNGFRGNASLQPRGLYGLHQYVVSALVSDPVSAFRRTSAYHSSVSTLHITNGDCAAGTLRTFLTDRVMVTCDVLHDGPAPPVDGDAWHDVRARFLAGAFDAAFDDTRAGLMAFDRTVTENGRFAEIVLWFEHDLFDQLLLIRTLDLLVRLKPDPTYGVGDGGAPYVGSSTSGVGDISESYVGSGFSRTDVSMICIGDFPGVDRFIGLGQLNADQLVSLLPDRKRVTPEQFALASKAWQAFRADDPSALHALMVRLKPDPTYNTGADDTLPFLHGAIHRLFEISVDEKRPIQICTCDAACARLGPTGRRRAVSGDSGRRAAAFHG